MVDGLDPGHVAFVLALVVVAHAHLGLFVRSLVGHVEAKDRVWLALLLHHSVNKRDRRHVAKFRIPHAYHCLHVSFQTSKERGLSGLSNPDLLDGMLATQMEIVPVSLSRHFSAYKLNLILHVNVNCCYRETGIIDIATVLQLL